MLTLSCIILRVVVIGADVTREHNVSLGTGKAVCPCAQSMKYSAVETGGIALPS
jgi:hypothetical protein